MPTSPILIVGAGGHALVVVDALRCDGWRAEDIVLCDHNEQRVGAILAGLEVKSVPPVSTVGRFHVAIGQNIVRRRLQRELSQAGGQAMTIVHPAAVVSKSALVEPGCLITAQSVVGPDVHVGEGVIVNHGAVVDHECIVGAFAHIGPGATLGGAAILEEACLIGAGARVLPGVVVGCETILGAGAVATDDLQAGAVYVGIPAMPVR